MSCSGCQFFFEHACGEGRPGKLRNRVHEARAELVGPRHSEDASEVQSEGNCWVETPSAQPAHCHTTSEDDKSNRQAVVLVWSVPDRDVQDDEDQYKCAEQLRSDERSPTSFACLYHLAKPGICIGDEHHTPPVACDRGCRPDRNHTPEELREHVGYTIQARKLSDEEQAYGHGGVEIGSRHSAERVDHDHERGSDAHNAVQWRSRSLHDDQAHRQHQHEGPQEFGHQL
mmetsp:Transcript_11729/g.41956  ORF Transcript_11729/g.41956 Transcript_11729/m.41956 type:complete len:229 (+) Transcript_11729:265-951(+)